MPEWANLALFVAGLAALGAAIWLVVRANLRVRRAEQAAEEAHSIKNDFVAMVSHELRTPLTSIAGFADTLISGWRDLPRSEERRVGKASGHRAQPND